ncbi:hypothetical protein [Frigoriglobus tundricola]|uniref:Uncharacterized protein n=1 Tax=Frigoriglobus tundricola TaxID=2774151 RepID=A0A6M5YRV3_9BACT|nr:hypothetical protein [Frigoriglobus tundricola]QJW95991.1 hypothetical protein FTUN_3545 [Frigoriglobus tundricola]
MATAECPACDRAVEVEDAYREWTVRCPHCDAEFVPNDVARAAAARRRREEEKYEDEMYGVPSAVRKEALQLVAGPALWLEICGWMSVLIATGIGALCIGLAVEIANNPQVNANDEPAALFAFLGCFSVVLGVPYGVAMAIGARKMRALSSRGWAMAAAILGVASFSMFGCWGLVPTGIGIWALVVLNKPAVSETLGPIRRNRT